MIGRVAHTRRPVQDMEELVILLGVIIDEELPIGADLCRVIVEDFQLVAEVFFEVIGCAAEEGLQRRRRIVERDEDQAAQDFGPHRPKPKPLPPQAAVPIGVGARDARAGAVEAVGPKVIETFEPAAYIAAQLAHEPGPAMRANVIKAAHNAILAADDDERNAGHLDRAIIAGCRQLAHMADETPAAREDRAPLFLEEPGVRVDPRIEIMGVGQVRRLGPTARPLLHHRWHPRM